MKGVKCFLDTNILVYAYDRSAGRKHHIAKHQVLQLWNTRLGTLSTQVLQEFFVNVTRKIPHPLDIPTARGIVEDFLAWEVVPNEGRAILAAIDMQQRYQLSFWDALIINAAVRSGATRLFSEDLQPGQQFQGIRVENPFLEE